jgi:hypothetical protein
MDWCINVEDILQMQGIGRGMFDVRITVDGGNAKYL